LCSEGIGLDIDGRDDRLPRSEVQSMLDEYPRLGEQPELHQLCAGWPVKGGSNDDRPIRRPYDEPGVS
jgi:hypothetical protein